MSTPEVPKENGRLREVDPTISAALQASERFAAVQQMSKFEKALIGIAIVSGTGGEAILLSLTVSAYADNLRAATFWGIATISATALNVVSGRQFISHFRKAKQAKKEDEMLMQVLLDRDNEVANKRLPPPRNN